MTIPTTATPFPVTTAAELNSCSSSMAENTPESRISEPSLKALKADIYAIISVERGRCLQDY
jgi:hypothetical protein